MKHYILFLTEWLKNDYYQNDMAVRKAFPQAVIEENSYDLTLTCVDLSSMSVTELATLLETAHGYEHLFLDTWEHDYLAQYL
jgi:hypothetical protein